MNRLPGFLLTLLLIMALLTGFTPGPEFSVDNSLNYNHFSNGTMIDSIVVHKAAHQMVVFSQSQAVKVYKIHLGVSPVGQKQAMGDKKTPEGLYSINTKNPNSSFHKSLGISYPSTEDVYRAQRIGKKPGGDIMIHGLPNGEEHVGPNRYQNDWTWGCIALSNAEIDELYQHIGTGVPILITP